MTRPNSYWNIVRRQFCRRRLALLSLLLVAILFLLAILAPFIANSRPLVLHGAFPGRYRELHAEYQHGAFPELWAALGTEKEAAALAAVQYKIAELDALTEDEMAGFIAGFALGVSNRDRHHLMTMHKVIVQDLTPERVHYRAEWYFPALAGLTYTDAFLLTFLATLLVTLLVRRWLSIPWPKLFLLIVVVSLTVGAARFAAPPVFANRDYKAELTRGAITADYVLFPLLPFGINESHLADRFAPPSGDYLLGTDGTGRDLFTRMLWGGRISLSVGFVSVGIAFVIGIALGTLSGYYRGVVDIIIMRIIEIMICFPTFFLILAVIAFIPPNIYNIMAVIGLTSWTGVARLTRAEFLRLADAEFVTAARALGVRDLRIIVRHILPNAIAPVLVQVSFGIAAAILVESSLSFLGFGITIPVPSWGGILSEARENFRYPWLTFAPGFMIFISVTAYNLIGEGLRDAIDPRMRQ